MSKYTSLLLGTLAVLCPVMNIHAAALNTSSTLMDLDPSSLQVTEFDKAIDDLPLMPGLTLITDNDVLFVTPHSGRIAKSAAEGVVDVDDVYKFYRRSLPQLGWKAADARNYVRDGEQLTIIARANGKMTKVEFSIVPLTTR